MPHSRATIHRSTLAVLSILVVGVALAACQPAATSAPAAVAIAVAASPAAADLPAPPPPVPSPTGTATAPVLSPTTVPTATLAPRPIDTPAVGAEPSSAVPIYSYRVVNVYPHDPAAFTQGLVYQDDHFYEGTGLRGASTLRFVDPATGQVLRGVRLPDQYFGEGIALLDDRLYQLTWQENTGFIYNKDSFELLGTWSYSGEGWGLTTDGQRLIMSDGTNELRLLDPETLAELGRVAVLDGDDQPVLQLNELEWVEGEVWANIWLTDRIARIDPASGRVLGWIDLNGLLPEEDRVTQRVDVLNGIAYDAATGRLFVTGKWWPKLFEIELVEGTP